MHRALLYTILGVSLAAAAAAQNQAQQSRNREVTHTGPAAAAEIIAAGTEIPVRTDNAINAKRRSPGRTYPATVSQDVIGTDGTLLIPRDARAELTVRGMDNNDLMVDLESVTVNGHRYVANAESYDRSGGTGLATNKRTGEYVSTRAKPINIPPETVLRFKLNRPLALSSGDR